MQWEESWGSSEMGTSRRKDTGLGLQECVTVYSMLVYFVSLVPGKDT